MNDLTLDQIEVDENFNFRKKYDEENDIFDNNLTSCEYGPYKIIGNIYRTNSAPKAELLRAIDIHNTILENILNKKNHSKCEIQICSDFNVNLLNFESHDLTNDYIHSLISKSFVPLITIPTRIKHMSATLIDHIWCNNICTQVISEILINSLSDHFPVFSIEETKQCKIDLSEQTLRKINQKRFLHFVNC